MSPIPAKEAELIHQLHSIVNGIDSLTRDLGIFTRRKASYEQAGYYGLKDTEKRIEETKRELLQHQRAFRRKMIQLRKLIDDPKVPFTC
jgi:putative ubiquitin-RnfH superfamily antitoxin RatB of RatAB toxin-antitoxin module